MITFKNEFWLQKLMNFNTLNWAFEEEFKIAFFKTVVLVTILKVKYLCVYWETKQKFVGKKIKSFIHLSFTHQLFS